MSYEMVRRTSSRLSFAWAWESGGEFSTYMALFHGSILANWALKIWAVAQTGKL
jgi:hypothetical protein